MLNSVSSSHSEESPRRRLSADERRRQLISIGLSRIIETPIQDLSLDQIAVEAGISRSLLFHYFPTKTDFYGACIEAAGRRVLRNTAPDPDLSGADQVAQVLGALIAQIIRRRDWWVTLVRPQESAIPQVSEMLDSVMSVNTDRVVEALGLAPGRRAVVHAWWAYVEDRALSLTTESPEAVADLVTECLAGLDALLAVNEPYAREA